MSEHSVADAAPQLAALIDRALAGEDIVITREGRPAVALRALAPSLPDPRALAEIDAWLRSIPGGAAAGREVSQMRDEEQRM